MLKRIRFLAVSAIFASLAMVLYPAAGTAALTLRQIQAADSYERTVWEGEEKERQEEWDRALEYNAELYKKQLTEPFRYMGGEAGDPVYEGCMFINANSSVAPGIVDANRQPVLEHSEVYSGVYGRASITLFAFNSGGSRGIACGLNNLQKLRDGEPLGSRVSAEDDFDTGDEDDFLS